VTDYATQKHDERYDTLIAKALKEDRSKGLGFNPITWKRRKIGGKLLLITNRKSHMSFRLVISRNLVGFMASFVQVVD